MTEIVSTYTVVSSNDRDRRVFFEGTESDARAFVQANYPRPHVEPGSGGNNAIAVPDVYVVSPDGVKAGWDGASWDDESDSLTPEPVAPAPVEVDPDEYTSPTGDKFRYDAETDSMVKETADVPDASVGESEVK